MFKKTIFWISIGSTTFLLITLNSLYGSIFNANNNGASSSGSLSPEQMDLIAQREAGYQLLVDQANQQLATAQALINAQSKPAEADPQGSQLYPISADAASQVAAVAANGSPVSGEAQLVDFEGTVAYEVPFQAGMIYVDANSGQVLFNGTLNLGPAKITAEQAVQIASAYMGNSNIYQVEATTLSGLNVYRVKFTNSDAVFVDEYGQILLVRLASTGPSSQTASHESDEREHEDDDD